MTDLPLVQQATKEAAMREMARRRLSWFLRYRFACENRPLIWNWHLDYLSDLMEAVTAREIKRLIINIPPRFLKSELISQTWQAWMIGRDNSPKSSVLSASATAELAERDSRKTREILESQWYANVFPNIERGDKWTDARWETKKGATRNSTGAEGTITGFGADHLTWDDLLLPDESNSETIRNGRNEWLSETLPSRHNDIKGGTITGIQQRLHERDSTGFIIDKMKNPDFDQYMLVVLPNEAPRRTIVEFHGKVYSDRKPRELLFPARLDAEGTRSKKATLLANYSGQYNQVPTKLEGGRLRPALLDRSPLSPSQAIRDWGLLPVIFIDLATKAKETNKDDPDYTVIQVWAQDQMHRRWLLYQWRKQAPHDEVAAALIAIRKTWGVTICKAEKIGLQHTFRATMRLACQLRNIPYFHVQDCAMSAGTDPIMKVAPFESALNSGIVVVPASATWLPEFEAELRQWPRGAHDDQCITAGYACSEFSTAVREGDARPHHPNLTDELSGDALMDMRARRSGPKVDADGWAVD